MKMHADHNNDQYFPFNLLLLFFFLGGGNIAYFEESLLLLTSLDINQPTYSREFPLKIISECWITSRTTISVKLSSFQAISCVKISRISQAHIEILHPSIRKKTGMN